MQNLSQVFVGKSEWEKFQVDIVKVLNALVPCVKVLNVEIIKRPLYTYLVSQECLSIAKKL